jgi:cell division protein FtsQ
VRAAAAATLRTIPRVALAIPASLRRRLLFALGALVVLWSLYHFWFRDSGFVKVEHVKIKGVTARNSDEIEAALTHAARDMTTMHVRKGALMSAVAGYTAVKDLEVTAHFPHTLTIRVIQEQPVAVLRAGGKRVLLSADGSVLSGVRAGRKIASIRTSGGAPATRLTDPVALGELRVVAAAPNALALRIASVGRGASRGIVVKLQNGPQIVFGDDTRLEAKWAAAAGVLADSSSKGASYVDVRLPARPVAGTFSVSSLQPLDTASSAATAAGSQADASAPTQGATGATGPTGPTGATGTTGLQGAGTNPQP